jgi:MFS family permease
MHKSSSDSNEYTVRRATYGGLIGAACGAVGAIVARPIVSVFADYEPWVLPAIAAGLVGGCVLALLLVPLGVQRRRRK